MSGISIEVRQRNDFCRTDKPVIQVKIGFGNKRDCYRLRVLFVRLDVLNFPTDRCKPSGII